MKCSEKHMRLDGSRPPQSCCLRGLCSCHSRVSLSLSDSYSLGCSLTAWTVEKHMRAGSRERAEEPQRRGCQYANISVKCERGREGVLLVWKWNKPINGKGLEKHCTAYYKICTLIFNRHNWLIDGWQIFRALLIQIHCHLTVYT